MGKFKNKLNPFTSQLQKVFSGDLVTFKAGVATFGDLPTEGNKKGDGRIANDTGHFYIWDGSTWQDQGDIVDLKWASIENKPTSSVEDIDNAVDNILPSTTEGKTYYVDCDNGSNSNPGTNAEPFATIQYAVDQVPIVVKHLITIYLKSSQNYNESITIKGRIGSGGTIYIRSVSGVSTDVLITGASDSNVFSILFNSVYIALNSIQLKVITDNKACVYAEGSPHVITYSVKVGDNGNTGTKGFDAYKNASVTIRTAEDIDANKVGYGFRVGYGGIILHDGNYVGDNPTVIFRSGIISDGINFNKSEYELIIAQSHIAGDDLALRKSLVLIPLEGNKVNQPFDALGDWVLGGDGDFISEISPAGQLHINVPAGAGKGTCKLPSASYNLSGEYTLEFRTYFDTLPNYGVSTFFRVWNIGNGQIQFNLSFGANGLWLFDGSDVIKVAVGYVKANGNAEYQTWRVVVKASVGATATCDIYLTDSTHTDERIVLDADCSSENANPGDLTLHVDAQAGENIEVHVDYLKIDDGIISTPILFADGTLKEDLAVDVGKKIGTKTIEEYQDAVDKKHTSAQNGAVNPTTVTPDYIGQIYVNTSPASGDTGLFIAIGLSEGNWTEI